jgi:hypothetical protein
MSKRLSGRNFNTSLPHLLKSRRSRSALQDGGLETRTLFILQSVEVFYLLLDTFFLSSPGLCLDRKVPPNSLELRQCLTFLERGCMRLGLTALQLLSSNSISLLRRALLCLGFYDTSTNFSILNAKMIDLAVKLLLPLGPFFRFNFGFTVYLFKCCHTTLFGFVMATLLFLKSRLFGRSPLTRLIQQTLFIGDAFVSCGFNIYSLFLGHSPRFLGCAHARDGFRQTVGILLGFFTGCLNLGSPC